MAITASQVKELRQRTGAGMMDCKKALTEKDGDLESAIQWLREKGISRAAKKAGRTAAEGVVTVRVSEDNKTGVVIELNCETDFSARNEEFQKFATVTADVALANKTNSAEQLLECNHEGKTLQDTLTALIATVGENMKIRRVHCLEAKDGVVAGYTHMGGKIGSLVALSGAAPEATANDVAMHIAAAAPRFLQREEVGTVELDKEKEVIRKRLQEQGKPEAIIEKALLGQINSYYGEVCLIDQPFVKEPKKKVAQYVKESNADSTITGFARFQLGEGIEVAETNFAEEVAAQIKS
ncbi:MAG: translation elongation factor Ts [Oligoflexales bacterium]